jgi:hypothetical protein
LSSRSSVISAEATSRIKRQSDFGLPILDFGFKDALIVGNPKSKIGLGV